jgi:Spy/CpxP family protein refolding chaperone
MKKLIALLSCVFFTIAIAHAQDSTDTSSKQTHKHEMKGKGGGKKGLKALNLSKDQQKQVDQVRADTRKQKEAINSDSSLTAEQKQEKIKAIEKDSKTKINNVLTPEQRQQLKQNKKGKKHNDENES